MDFDPINDIRCRLGESPYWWVERQTLLWVDVHNGNVHEWSADAGSQSAHVAERVAFVLPAASGELVLGLRNGLATLKSLADADGSLEPSVPVEADWPHTALNDARCDQQGRLWFGSMDRENREPIAGLYRWDLSGLARVVEGVSLSNGIQFSPTGDVMYFVDSWTQRLDAFEYDQATGDIGRRWTVVEVPAEDGMPDGINVDTQGRIYVALYGGGCIQRYLPDGTREDTIEIPVQFPSSCTFGGTDLKTLYVTSAEAGHSGGGPLRSVGGARRYEDAGLDGAVFAAEIDVAGLVSPTVARVA